MDESRWLLGRGDHRLTARLPVRRLRVQEARPLDMAPPPRPRWIEPCFLRRSPAPLDEPKLFRAATCRLARGGLKGADVPRCMVIESMGTVTCTQLAAASRSKIQCQRDPATASYGEVEHLSRLAKFKCH